MNADEITVVIMIDDGHRGHAPRVPADVEKLEPEQNVP